MPDEQPDRTTSNLTQPGRTRLNLTKPPLMNFSWISEALGRPPIGWRDVVDIAIVSILIYEVLTLIRGTRAAQMAVGGALAVGLFYVSRLAELETVNWLIRNLIGYIVFAAIVLFQSDIRRALAHLGRAPFFRYLAKGETVDETVEEIAVAAQMLSSQRTGAIIAIERQIGLRNYAEGGIPLDAQISYDLLVTIFQNGTPLHDGAVIIQENRVAAAACFLPLTVNPRLSKDLGTRHRAAIGLTEENDAVAVVVSEETGWVSIVLEGRIERNLTPERLRGRLRELLRPRRSGEPSPAGARGRLTCGLASSGTSAPRCCPSGWRRCCGASWQGNAKPSVPCECRSSIATSRPSSSCWASPRRWSTCASAAAAACSGELRGADLVAVLDLRSARPGRRLFHLLPGDIAVPAGVKVLQATPSTLSLTFEASAVRTVPVVPDLDGDPAPGFIVGTRHHRAGHGRGRRPHLRRPEDHRSDDRAGGHHRRHHVRPRHGDHRAARHARAPAQPAKRRGDDRNRSGAGGAHPRTRARGAARAGGRAPGDADAGHGKRDRAGRKPGGVGAHGRRASSSTRTCLGSTPGATIFPCATSQLAM